MIERVIPDRTGWWWAHDFDPEDAIPVHVRPNKGVLMAWDASNIDGTYIFKPLESLRWLGPCSPPPTEKRLSIHDVVEQSHARAMLWHPGGLQEWTMSDWFVAMAGEAGEACNAVKKLRRLQTGARQANGPTAEAEAVRDIGYEIADVFLYLVLCAEVLRIDFEEAVREKFNAISEREGFPQRL